MKKISDKDVFDPDYSWFYDEEDEDSNIISDYIDITAWDDEEEFEKFKKHGNPKEEF